MMMMMKSVAARAINRASWAHIHGARVRAFSFLVSPPSKAVIYDEHNLGDVVPSKVVHLPPVEVKEKDVCVKMLAAPINISDIHPTEVIWESPLYPVVGGHEGVGEVYSVGSAVKDLEPGDLVIPFPPSSGIPCPPSSGTWRTYIVKDESTWHKISKDTPIEYAATVTVNPLTALRLLEDFVTLNSGDSIVQNGATSIAGQCIIQLARFHGIHSINIIRDTPGSIEAKEMLKGLGADEVFTGRELEAYGRKRLPPTNLPEPALGFNFFGGCDASWVLKFLRQGGTMVTTHGGILENNITVPTSAFIFKDLSLKGFFLQKWIKSDKAKEWRNMIDYLLCLAREGKLKYEMELVPFDNFHTAMDKARGKLGSQPKQVLKF